MRCAELKIIRSVWILAGESHAFVGEIDRDLVERAKGIHPQQHRRTISQAESRERPDSTPSAMGRNKAFSIVGPLGGATIRLMATGGNQAETRAVGGSASGGVRVRRSGCNGR